VTTAPKRWATAQTPAPIYRYSQPLRAGRPSGPPSARALPPAQARYDTSLGDGAALPVALATPPKCGVRRCANPVRPRPALSEHSIKAARRAAKYNLVSRILEATSPNAGARGIAPRDALGLRFRHTEIDACLVTVGAFFQTHRKPMSLPLRERRFLGNRERHGCRGHNPKDQQRRHRYFAKIRHYPKGRTDHRPASITFPRGTKRASSSWLDGDRSKDTFSAFC
jgi:hypothetical protein